MNLCKKCGKNFEPTKGLVSYCSLECRNSRTWTDADKLKKSISAKKSSKVLTANRQSPRKRKTKKLYIIICLGCGKEIHTKKKNQKYHNECWLTNSGGYRINSTMKHRSVYGGYQMDSNAEKEFAILCDKNNVKWVKNTNIFFDYIGNDGKKHKYYPDFYLKDYDYWVEIKGKFYAEKDPNLENKLNSVNRIKIIYSKEIRHFNFNNLI